MKNYLILLFFLFGITACETDFDVTSDWKEIPIVYGLLDRSNSVQYIRINKSYLGEVDALDAAQVLDSLYFDESMEVRIKSFRFGIGSNPDNPNLFNYQDNINYDRNDVLERVRLEDEGYEKEDGTFANDPAYVYKYTRQLDEDRGYVLEFTTPAGEKIRAFTPIVEDIKITRPQEGSNLNLEIANNSEDFEVRWNNADNASIFDITFDLVYSEAPTIDLENDVFKSIVWTPVRNYDVEQAAIGTNYYSRSIQKESFYNYLNSVIPKDDSKLRFLQSLRIKVFGANEEYRNYINANAAQTGISSGQVKPEYSNIDGGLGIFSTVSESQVSIIQFLNEDEWACEYDIISELNFAPSEGNTNWPYCF